MRKRSNLFTLVQLVLVFTLLAGSRSFAAGEPEKTDRWLNAPGADRYPGSTAVVLYDNIGFTYNDDGSTVMTEHEVIKILNYEGLEKYSQVIRAYVRPNQAIAVETARIIKPDGTIIELDEDKQILHETKFAEEAPLYKDLVIMTIDFSSVEINDVIEFKLLFYNKDHMPRDYFWGISFTGDEVPIKETCFFVDMYRDKDKLRWLIVGNENDKKEPEVTSLEGGTRYSWKWEDRDPIGNEPSAPAFKDRASYIMVSTFPSWEAMSEAYYNFFKPYVSGDGLIKKKTAEITKDIEDPREKLTALVNFIYEKKSLSLTFNPEQMLLIKPDSLLDSEVISQFNASILFVSMARAAGFEAYPVLMSDQKFGDVNEQLPSPFQFNRAIATVKVGKEWIYVDPTSPSASALKLYAGQEGRGILPLVPGGKGLAVTSISPAESNLEKMTVNARLSEDGSIGITMNLLETGTKKILWDTVLSVLESPASQQIVFSKIITSIHENAELLSFEKDQESEKDTVNMKIILMAEDYPLASGRYWIIKLPVIASQQPDFVTQMTGDRKFPVIIGGTSREIREVKMTIPEGFTVKSVPEDVVIENEVGSFSVKCTIEGNVISFVSDLKIQELKIPVSQFNQVVELYKKSATALKQVILLEKPHNDNQPTG